MKCEDVRRLLHPYADGELDLVRHVEIEGHLSNCDSCADQKNNLSSLRSVVSIPSLRLQAPAPLRDRVQRDIASLSRPRRRPVLSAPAFAAAAVFVAVISAGVFFVSSSRTTEDRRLAEAVVASHVRSLQVDHLTDVASTDQHTVKPWFRGKLDYSPPVVDLGAQGFPLTGGRLDYLAGRPVAALVYHRRAHAVNLFLWPAESEGEVEVRNIASNGFHLRRWRHSGMSWWAVSDLNGEELDEFVRLMRSWAVEGPR